MKVRNLYFGAAFCAVALASSASVDAQGVYVAEAEMIEVEGIKCENHYYSNWRNNWFIQLGAGINQPFVEKGVGVDRDIKDIDRERMTVAYNFGFGRWMSPYLGFRINAIGGALHWDNPTKAEPMNGWTRGKHVNVNFELMWDMFNSLGGVNANRVFSIIPFAGFGGDYMWRINDSNKRFAAASNINGTGDKGIKDESWTLPVTAGIQFRFRLCKYVDFFAEARATFYGDNWNLCSYGDPIDVNVAALGGFNINFGGRGWNTFNMCDYAGKLANANAQVNELRAELGDMAQRLANCNAALENIPAPVQKDCVNAPLMTTVRFTINSYAIMPTEEVNIYNMAEWLKANPKENVIVAGYADKDTGTTDYNMELSQKRCQAVIDALVNKYGISSSRLTPKAFGSDVQEYSENDWNRIVIFTQK